MSTRLQLAPQDQASATITVLLADGHDLIRSSIRSVLGADEWIAVVAEAADIAAVSRELQAHRPQVLVLDLRLGSPSPFKRIRELRRDAPGTAIVVTSMESGRAFADRALGCGAIAYVLKDHAETDLPAAIRCAAAGRGYVSPYVLEGYWSRTSTRRDS